ncbi:Mannosyl phosphorylinositol ceramide synthase SUR1 [Tolypocladium capitatum]|uniref:Mannosyl phosphorylinositol ceramide synthase SUR1 n=1 Tax=Tolypocladium capitatum TaxID=45235 RepID=A0A2K3QH12_9HYPO|nr:Mannosyl phosphorylinositol ceramide synthase SUR1 [Tolypocladium capitatum]
MHKPHSLRPPSTTSKKTRTILWATGLILVATVWFCRHLARTSWTLAALRVIWRANSADFVLSSSHDAFDITFANYSRDQLSAAPYDDAVPPILHHIALGKHGDHWRGEWEETVQSCLDWHPGWESHLWTDDAASKFVAERFPDLKELWDGYRYPVERIDALRYMVLYEFGGVILDMDLKCKRALGPLRRFSFVAPEAHPTGFSIGFMMASKHNSFVGDIVRNLTVYDRQWLGLPYPTVMFSTGCHFASVIHAYQTDRTSLKILPGPMHSLNGRVSTPIFDHLGSSSWHSYDAQLIVSLGSKANLLFFICVGMALALLFRRRWIRRRL